MSEWQPIETAPMDGTRVDLWCRRSWMPPETHERSTDMYWCTTHKCWRKTRNLHFIDDGWKQERWCEVERRYVSHRHLIPEYWMPLPEPPK